MKKLLVVVGMLVAASLGASAQTVIPPDVQKLLQKNTCLACHNVDKKLVGPSYKEIMQKKKYSAEQIVELIYKPKPSNWPGYPPMAAMANVPKAEALKIATWISKLK
ncbi:MAG: c-type cytochrome [Spirosomataceae bacterium]